MKRAYQNFTSSKVTSKEMATKLVNIKNQIPQRFMNSFSTDGWHSDSLKPK